MEREEKERETEVKIIDTSPAWLSSFGDGGFDREKWEKYIDAAVPGAKDLCLSDMREVDAAGYPWESEFLPVLNAMQKERIP